MFSKVMVLLVIYVYFLMSVLDENIGTIYKRVYDMYDMRLHTYPGNAVNQVYDMLRLRKYPVEDMPSKKELYRMIQDELVQFGFVSFLNLHQLLGSLKMVICLPNIWALALICGFRIKRVGNSDILQ